MSGLNRKISLLAYLYIFLVLFLVGAVFFYPKFYNYLEERRVATIEQEIQKSLLKESSVTQELEKVSQQRNLELIVFQEEQPIYQSLPDSKISTVEKYIKKKNLAYQDTYNLKINKSNYLVWLAIYPENIQERFNKLSFFVGIALLIAFTILTLVLIFVYKVLLDPLNKLKESILHLKRLDFEKAILLTSVSDEGILNDLSSFSENMKSNIDHLGTRFTELELERQKEHDLRVYKEKLTNSLIHDLKTPLNILIMMIEVQLEKDLTKAQTSFLKDLLKRHHMMLEEVNHILKVSSKKAEIMVEQEIDLVMVIRETMSRFKSLVRNKKMYGEFDLPRSFVVGLSRIEADQLMHNAISNLVNYSPVNGYFSIQLVETEEGVLLRFYNEAANLEAIDFDHVFDLFYQGSQSENKYSSGLGLYTIHEIISRHNGESRFYSKDQGVVLELSIPTPEIKG